jgi:predicted TIM-barrel fold metal-dependent hydrolase
LNIGFQLTRRDVIRSAMLASAAPILFQSSNRSPAQEASRPQLVDSNVSLFQWPFRRLPLDETGKLVAKLRALGFTRAWAGSFEALLHRDIAGVNQRLSNECARYSELIPIGSINLELPGWEDDFRRCVEVHNMPGIRLHPNYHGYSLERPDFHQLLDQAASAGLFVQIAVAMEDARTQHPQLQVPDVNLSPLLKILPQIPKARVQILNARSVTPQLEKLGGIAKLYFDTARMDGTDAVPRLMERLPSGRVLYGSHAPFLIPEAALIRTHESGQLDARGLQALLSENASHFSRMPQS